MDLNDPGMIGFVERSAPRVLAFPTNWLEEGSDVWTYWAWRMDTTRTALVAANTWGEERGVAHDVMVYSEPEVERIVRVAASAAQGRER